MITEEQRNALTNALPVLGNSREFAESLLRQSVLPRGLSAKQMAWVIKLLERAATRTVPVGAPVVPIAMPVRQTNALEPGGVEVVRSWLQRMRDAGTLNPRLRYTVAGRKYTFSLPGPTSLYAGRPVIFVKSDRTYIGRIQDDCFHTQNADAAGVLVIMAALRAITLAPLAQAVATGHETGSCCFCGRELTDRRSIFRGYGPICADRLGLPWGGAADDVAADAAPILPPAPVADDGLDDEDRRFM